MPKGIPWYKSQIINIDLHKFADASTKSVCSTLHALIHQASGASKVLVRWSDDLKLGVDCNQDGNKYVGKGKKYPKDYDNSGYSMEQKCSYTALYQKQRKLQTICVWKNKEDARKNFPHKETSKHWSKSSKMGRKNGARYDITEMYFGGREWLSAEEKWLPDVSTVSTTEEKTEPNVAKEVFSVATKSKLNILKELLKKYSF